MSQPRSVYLPLLGHEIHVMEWGDKAKPAVVLWHGLARTGRDFDELAAGLTEEYFVLCPDTIGRGLSSWAHNPDIEYCLENYAAIAIAMLDHYSIENAIWIGTSMGGLIGMHLASGPGASRLAALVVNDIGPEIPEEATNRILTYAADLPVFQTVCEAGVWLRTVYTPFGPAREEFWQRMTETSVRRTDAGEFTIHYDPMVISQFTASPGDFKSWKRYEQIKLPTHLIWGVNSDVLTKVIVDRMKSSGPKPGVSVYHDCGHAPTLSRLGDIAAVKQILGQLLEKRIG